MSYWRETVTGRGKNHGVVFVRKFNRCTTKQSTFKGGISTSWKNVLYAHSLIIPWQKGVWYLC